ncbi:hypothetical protein SAMN06264849_11422 [Melghirimyces algeriensis]|uniref:Uncharacterized protein n=1 Tax=Melghirimyces algeriensis TaxID=910412 RepID=A0A521F7M6_9BACL|nr:hypothetical protein SAMN06264849_11422 [Melghirimyces algeriensis]
MHINPFWLNRVSGGDCKATAISPRTVELEGELLDIHPSDDIHLHPGELVHITALDFIYFSTEKEIEEEQKKIKEMREKEERERRDILNRRRDEAEKFNASIKVPVKWTAAIKLVKGGLLENSWGDGRNKRTVQHILIQEDLKEGRLKRSAGEFLCKAGSGRLWDDEEKWWDGEGQTYTPKITCKTCLKIAKRWESAPKVRRA